MDRIENMDAKEKDAALRRLIVEAQDALAFLSATRCTGARLRAALAAFDPTPLDVAKAALEKAGFVEITAGGDRDGDVFISSQGKFFCRWRLKEPA